MGLYAGFMVLVLVRAWVWGLAQKLLPEEAFPPPRGLARSGGAVAGESGWPSHHPLGRLVSPIKMGLGGVLSLGTASILLHFHSVKSVTHEGKGWGFLCMGGWQE